jgi:hypothetical protein
MSPLTIIYGSALALSLVAFISWRVASFAEQRQFWTFRLRQSLSEQYLLLPGLLGIAISAAYTISLAASTHLRNTTAAFAVSLVADLAIFVGIVEFGLREIETHRYKLLRWKAWTGPSRTGIPEALAQYIGDSGDWIALRDSVRATQLNPVERFSSLVFRKTDGIIEDPTDLLRERSRLDQRFGISWSPQSQDKVGVFQPMSKDAPVSLLWGENLGFHRRCSRGIISVSLNLLTASPSIGPGFRGNSVCLAYGILARNKGPNPAKLLCNLKDKNTLREFEEASILWPRPAKTLRSHYYSEFEGTFALLGPSYVSAATELALLLEDSPPAMIASWLDSQFEHQDLAFNLKAYAAGASSTDLERLYRGHYATMLVSLSAYRVGCQIRPELTVFDAICAAEGVATPLWASSDDMLIRRQRELLEYGPALLALVNAII